ncbi:hypothetical protein GQ600_8187 [Phytophthora cactorum]|nr:hypothetical protein GQ600_8187 [Phytophthora cactorum]
MLVQIALQFERGAPNNMELHRSPHAGKLCARDESFSFAWSVSSGPMAKQ